MTIHPVQVTKALRKGYAFPCAMCDHLWWGLDRGLDECKMAIEGKECGGPISGLAYPEYKGPMARETLAKVCFRCGADTDQLVEGIRDKGRYIGVCKRHLPILDRLVEK